MIPQKYRYYLMRFQEIGLHKASHLLFHKLKRRNFIKKKRYNTLYLSWDQLAQTYKLPVFKIYFEKLKSLEFFNKILTDHEFIKTWPETFLDQSNGPKIDLLGFGQYTFKANAMPWHDDVTANQPSPDTWKTSFYCDVGPANFSIHPAQPDTRRDGVETDSSTLRYKSRCDSLRMSDRSRACPDLVEGVGLNKNLPDIKIPWELSRFQHLFPLGLHYSKAEKSGNHALLKEYSHIFQANVSDWIHKNPYLMGVNWVCPMEVGIRATNLIWGFHFFKNSPHISQKFWQQFICVLFHHAEYLESNLEVSDKPNNHYLADLLGYLYLSTFLIDIKIIYQTKKWVLKEIIKQLKHQVLPDGTSYEGSTAYHRLNTEMVLHVMLLAKYTDITLPGVENLYNKMLRFLDDCHDESGNLVQIGDNDSGKILVGIKILKQVQDDNSRALRVDVCHPEVVSGSRSYTISTYPNFGLSIIKTKNWHLTFRHPAYKKNQPTGHFHQDLLSFTLSIDGIPIIVDPGSCTYTANPSIRNKFRSASRHNSLYLKEKNWGNTTIETIDLFQMPRKEHHQKPLIHKEQDMVTIEDSHQEYAFCGFAAHRKLEFDAQKEILCITDWWSSTNQETNRATWLSSLTFSPDITLEKIGTFEHIWLVKKNRKSLATIEANHNLTIDKTTFSSDYGSCKTSLMLTASTNRSVPLKIVLKRIV